MAVLILLLAAVLAVLCLAVIPVFRLRQAETARSEGDYDTAIAIYEHYGTLYHADELLQEAQYEKADAALSSEDYSTALDLFSALGSYRDSASKKKEAELGTIRDLIDSGACSEALEQLEALDESYEGKDELIQLARYRRAELLAGIGKLEDAEAELEDLGDYEGAADLLESVRYNLAVCLLEINDFSSAKTVLEKTGDVSDAGTLLSLCQSAFDGVYTCVYTDNAGRTEPGADSYLWLHSVIGTGTTSVVLGAQEDYSIGSISPSLFGASMLNYVYYQSPEPYTYLFSYAGSEDDSDDGESACYMKLVVSEDGSSLTTSIVDAKTLEEVENDRKRTWQAVTDGSTADSVRDGFRRRMKTDLALSGNAYFADATDSPDITHYCCVTSCTNEGTLVAEDSVSRSYYCEDHRQEYEKDSRTKQGS